MICLLLFLITAVLGDDTTDLVAMTRGLTGPALPVSWNASYPACSWYGVGCNAPRRVTSITWMLFSGIAGPVDFTRVPRAATAVTVSGLGFSGIPDLSSLPTTLITLDIGGTRFSGPLDLTRFPTSLREAVLGPSNFSGRVDLTNLPGSMVTLALSGNRLTGTPDLSRIPPSLTDLYLERNEFSGEWDLSVLQGVEVLWLSNNMLTGNISKMMFAPSLTEIYLDSNNFVGTPDFNKLPEHTTVFSARKNNMSGELVLSQLPATLLRLYLSDNRFSGDLNLTLLPPNMTALYLVNNSFTGTPDFTHLPVTLTELQLNMNRLSGTPNLMLLPPNLGFLALMKNEFCDVMTIPNTTATNSWCVKFESFDMCYGGGNGQVQCPPGNKWVSSFEVACGACPIPPPLTAPPPDTGAPGTLIGDMLDLVRSMYGPKPQSWRNTVEVCSWTGITCDAARHVVAITWGMSGMGGTLDFALVPRTVVAIQMSMGLRQYLNLTSLPPRLTSLDLSNNFFSGTLDAGSLPRSLVALNVTSNELEGEVAYEALPRGLAYLDLSRNHFSSQSIVLQTLPQLSHFNISRNNASGTFDFLAIAGSRVLQTLDLSCNNLTGSFNTSSLPRMLSSLTLTRNSFSGPVGKMTYLPSRLTAISFSHNAFSGRLLLDGLSASHPAMRTIECQANGFEGGPLNLSDLPISTTLVNLSYNKLSGEVDMSHTPNGLETLDVAHNALSCPNDVDLIANIPHGPNFTFCNLAWNNFSGVLNLTFLPGALVVLRLEGNGLYGEPWMVPPNNAVLLETLDLTGNALSGSLDVRGLWQLTHLTELRLGYNTGFAGSADFTMLPSTLQTLDISATGLCSFLYFSSNARWCENVEAPSEVCTLSCEQGYMRCPACTYAPGPTTPTPVNTPSPNNASTDPVSVAPMSPSSSESDSTNAGVIAGAVVGGVVGVVLMAWAGHRYHAYREQQATRWTFNQIRRIENPLEQGLWQDDDGDEEQARLERAAGRYHDGAPEAPPHHDYTQAYY